MSQNVPKKKLKTASRRIKVIELRAKGWTIDKIAGFLKVSEKTIDRDLKSVDVVEFVDELVRRQIEDIESVDEGERLRYRDKLLDKLIPRRIESKVKAKVETSIKPVIDWQNLSEDERNSLIDAARILVDKNSGE